MKVAFLDRDGTIIRDYSDQDWRFATEPEFLDGAIHALKAIQALGYRIIIVTNQYLIGEGIITKEDYDRFSERFVEVLHVQGVEPLDIFCCPHARNSGCDCCKPGPGLIWQALEKYPDIDLKESFLCGDSSADEGLAEHFGLRFFGINIDCSAGVRVGALGELTAYVR